MASFGPRRQSECGQKPGGFTRLTPEVLGWVKTVTPNVTDIQDPGDMRRTNIVGATYKTIRAILNYMSNGNDGSPKCFY